MARPSSISAASVAHQTNLKQQLRNALAHGDDSRCWARLEKIDAGGVMKLLAVNGSFYSFLSHGQRCDTHKADNWLVHEDEFYVHWVGEGPNRVGATLTGEELEASFFMYSE